MLNVHSHHFENKMQKVLPLLNVVKRTTRHQLSLFLSVCARKNQRFPALPAPVFSLNCFPAEGKRRNILFGTQRSFCDLVFSIGSHGGVRVRGHCVGVDPPTSSLISWLKSSCDPVRHLCAWGSTGGPHSNPRAGRGVRSRPTLIHARPRSLTPY